MRFLWRKRFVAALLAAACLLVGYGLLAAPERATQPAEPQQTTGQQPAAPDETPPPVPPALAVRLAYADSLRVPDKDAVYVRYMWTDEPESRWADELLLAKYHANLRSDQGKFGEVVLVAPGLFRLDLRDFGWDRPGKIELWEKFAGIDFFFHSKAKLLEDSVIEVVWPGGKENGEDFDAGIYESVKKKKGDLIDIPEWRLPPREINGLRHRLLTEAPVLHARWVFVQTARQVSIRNADEGVGYYAWLGIKNRKDFFALTGTDEKLAAKLFTEWRGVVRRSGIGQQVRQVVALNAVARRVWGTLDVFRQAGRGQALRNLRRGEFKHDAEEWYGFLGNGLPITALFNAQGEAQATAPDQIGPDDSQYRVGKDPRVHVNLSCMRCHGTSKDMLQPCDEALRRTFRFEWHLRLLDPDKRVHLELESQYLRNLDELLADDRVVYVRAIRRCTATAQNTAGLSSPQITRLYCTAWNEYVEEPVTARKAARELGVSEGELLRAIIRHARKRGGSDLILSQFLDPRSGGLTRLEWEECYALAAALVHGAHPPEVAEVLKVNQ